MFPALILNVCFDRKRTLDQAKYHDIERRLSAISGRSPAIFREPDPVLNEDTRYFLGLGSKGRLQKLTDQIDGCPEFAEFARPNSSKFVRITYNKNRINL